MSYKNVTNDYLTIQSLSGSLGHTNQYDTLLVCQVLLVKYNNEVKRIDLGRGNTLTLMRFGRAQRTDMGVNNEVEIFLCLLKLFYFIT